MACRSKGYTDVKRVKARRKLAPFLSKLKGLEVGFLSLSEEDRRRGFGYFATLWMNICGDMQLKADAAGIVEEGKPFRAPWGAFQEEYGRYSK